MIIISYNLSWATQENQKKGTEAGFVKACKNKYGNKEPNKLSPCTQNALNLLVKFIKQHLKEQFIICIQEGTNIQTINFIEELNKQTSYRFLSVSSDKMDNAYLYTIYDRTLGEIQGYNKGELTDFISGNPEKKSGSGETP